MILLHDRVVVLRLFSGLIETLKTGIGGPPAFRRLLNFSSVSPRAKMSRLRPSSR